MPSQNDGAATRQAASTEIARSDSFPARTAATMPRTREPQTVSTSATSASENVTARRDPKMRSLTDSPVASDVPRSPVDGVAQPVDVPDDHRVVEVEPLADRLHLLLGGVVGCEPLGGVTGSEVDQQEDQERDEDEHRDRQQHPAPDERQHGPSSGSCPLRLLGHRHVAEVAEADRDERRVLGDVADLVRVHPQLLGVADRHAPLLGLDVGEQRLVQLGRARPG